MPCQISMHFALNINHLIEQRRLKKTDVAKALNISRARFGNYTSGTSEPKFEVAIAIARYFNVNLDDLIMKDLTREDGRPFGAEGEDVDPEDVTLARMNELLEHRLRQVEQALLRSDPDLARELGIE